MTEVPDVGAVGRGEDESHRQGAVFPGKGAGGFGVRETDFGVNVGVFGGAVISFPSMISSAFSEGAAPPDSPNSQRGG